jgi:N-acetyl-beta-hexosaminidase
LPLSNAFKIHLASSSAIAQASVSRYQQFIKPTKLTSGLKQLDVLVATNNNSPPLGSSTNYSYTLTIADGSATASCASVFAVAYALETFSQLVGPDGNLVHSSVHIVDYPAYKHRGILLDAGRRFYRIDFLHLLIDGLAFAKMNVLHLHFSDFPASRIESKLFPQLTSKLVCNVTGERAYYTQEEVVALVAYAKARGVRVVPELDIPGHSGGLASLVGQGVEFCDSTRQKTLFDDPQNKTWDVVRKLVVEWAPLFEDELFHMGCDETIAVGQCNEPNFQSFEQKMMALLKSLGKTPMGWEEIVTSTKAATPDSGVVIGTWSQYNASYMIGLGFEAVESKESRLYLQEGPFTASKMWIDISAGISPVNMSKLLGGEVSVWGNPYCFSFLNCTRSNKSGGESTGWMYEYDAEYEQSVVNLLFPRVLVAAAAFWNFNTGVDPSEEGLVARYRAHASRIALRSPQLQGCPFNCTCSPADRCGVPYQKPAHAI